MPLTDVDKMYKELIGLYEERGYANPELSLNHDIEKLRSQGKSRDRAITMLHKKMKKQLNLRREADAFTEKRVKELEKELSEMRTSIRQRAEEIESIKKYLAYTHRLTTSQYFARIGFYVLGAALVILSLFQYRYVVTYIEAPTGGGWVWILNCFVTFVLGISTVTIGWVLESMARSRPAV
jgi:hypothetical protein